MTAPKLTNPHVVITRARYTGRHGHNGFLYWRAHCHRCGANGPQNMTTSGMAWSWAGDHQCPPDTAA